MPSSSSSFARAAAAGGGGAIPSGASSTLSPNAAPYTFLARQGRAPPGGLSAHGAMPLGCHLDQFILAWLQLSRDRSDASRLIDDNSVLNGEVDNAYPASLATHFGTKPSNAVHPSNAHGMRQSQPSSSRGSPASVYPSPSSSVSESSVTIASNFNQRRIPMTLGRVTVTIRSPPNKTSETDNTSFGSSKMATRQNDESNKETGKVLSFRGNLEFSNPTNGNGTSQGTMVPVKGVSDKAGGLKACYSQNAVSKSVTGNYNGSYTADNGKGIIVSNSTDSSRLLGELRKKCVTGYQPSLNNFPKELSCEEDHSQVLIYKNLWIDAERANCALKYQLKQTRLEIDLESSRAHTGGCPRIPPFHLRDTGRDPSSSHGSAITTPLMLKDHPGGRKSHNLLYDADHIQSGDSSVLSRSKGNITVPNNIEDEYFLSGLEETGVHPHAHSGLLIAPSRAHRGLDASTSDGMPSLSHISGSDGILCESYEFGSSDWEHVLKEEIGST
ncbi:uncharacterized protein C2845_PM13G03660 [Panicum miliaceum]|uniref:Uncharacterized protein n=1 Tax=Panicum miliaceum TaxID=4540 RepID=A0A3L6RIP6_PANMI|nr:uncharacterized protein C2845_PM13G03660 [Panicum miliaceum]